MKKSIFILTLLAFIAIGFTSCNTNDGDNRPWVDTTGTIVYGGGTKFNIKIDAYGIVIPTNMPITTGSHTWREYDRAYLGFYLNEEEDGSDYRSIELTNIMPVPTSYIERIDTPEGDTLGTAPFFEVSSLPNSMWISDNYITARFVYFYQNITKHSFYLSCPDPTEIYQGADTIHLNFSHKTEDEHNTSSTWSFHSFRVDDLLSPVKDSVTFTIKMPIITDPQETTPKTKTISLTYKLERYN